MCLGYMVTPCADMNALGSVALSRVAGYPVYGSTRGAVSGVSAGPFPLAARPNPACPLLSTGLSTSPGGSGCFRLRCPRGWDLRAPVAVTDDLHRAGVKEPNPVPFRPPVLSAGP